MNTIEPKPGTPTSVRRGELDVAPFARVRDLPTNVYKTAEGKPLIGYVESLSVEHNVIKDLIIQHELGLGILVNDGSGTQAPAQLPPAPPPTPVAQVIQMPNQPIVVAPVPQAAPAAEAPRVSRRRQAQNGVAVAPPPAPAPTPMQMTIPGSAPEQTTPPRTPVPSNGFTPPSAPAVPQSASFTAPVVATFSPPAFSPPSQMAQVAAPAAQASVDLGPVLQGIQSLAVGLEHAVKNSDGALKGVTDLKAQVDHLAASLWYIWQGIPSLNQVLVANKIDSLSKFKQYTQFLSNPQ